MAPLQAYALLNTAKDLGNDRAKVLLGMSHLTGENPCSFAVNLIFIEYASS